MYLMQLDPVTGLVKEDPDMDGWMAIESFRELYHLKGYGIYGLTVVALVVDYGSVFSRYSEKERPLKAIENIYGKRDAILWNCDEMQIASIAYADLQYNATLEEKKIIDNLRVTKLQEIQDAESTFDKQKLLRELGSINDMHDVFDKKNSSRDLFTKSPVRNGYTLSRLETKIEDPKSFYYERKQRESERLAKSTGNSESGSEN